MTVLRNDQFTVFLLKRNPNLPPPPLPHHVFLSLFFLFVCLGFVCLFFFFCQLSVLLLFLFFFFLGGGGVVSLLFAVVVVFSFVFVFAGLRYFPKIRVQFIARDEFYEII